LNKKWVRVGLNNINGVTTSMATSMAMNINGVTSMGSGLAK